ncbi:GspH/FimT family pseudopilin [Vibrio ziniensis]|uniref:Type II secretion system protein H n=1 Tax=Vibrio ziniensis TaxID=2711221 RepID=A0A6G7CG96_9VIBR|nr:GspH/FimT family pseudopilin [Vibrio ziniensis]QIH41122.1 prepilin-type N-terminal cleavage/methylation domain-containing protein [Vibrio ziniensis]
MPRGFTLLEMMLTMAVLTILLSASIPNFYQFQQRQKIKALAQELHGFLIQAKSEAVYRNTDLWAHIRFDSNPTFTGDWEIRLTNSDKDTQGETIQLLNGNRYRDVIFSSSYLSNQIKFDGVRGKITNGHLSLSSIMSTQKKLQFKSSFGASRILICGEGEALYGYPMCV